MYIQFFLFRPYVLIVTTRGELFALVVKLSDRGEGSHSKDCSPPGENKGANKGDQSLLSKVPFSRLRENLCC
jgi:hypothetical protein